MGQLEDMSVFIRVVEAHGIGRAAEQLGLAKSAVSRRLADLEARLGVCLLNRTTRTSSLTEAGKSYYEYANKIIDDVAELNTSTTNANKSLEGTLKLAAPLSFGLLHLPAVIDAFVKENPNVSINIDFSDRQVDLVEEGLDLAFRITKLKDSSLIARKISPIRMLPCASPSYLEAHGTPTSPEDLKQHDLLNYNVSDSSNWKFTDKNGKQYSVNPSAKFSANNGDFLKDMAIAGHGITVIPTFISWQAIASGDLLPVLSEYRFPALNAYAVYPKTRYLSRRTRKLIDFLVERFGEKPYWDTNINI